MSTVQIMSLPACVQCTASKKLLTKLGVQYEETDLTMDSKALEESKALGHRQAPVVVVRNASGAVEAHWSGFRPENLQALVK